MKLDLIDMFCAMSFALGAVEAELLGIETGHCKRVTYLALLMAKEAGFGEEELREYAGCCILHDNALTEYIHEELSHSSLSSQLSIHIDDVMVPNPESGFNDYHSVIGEQNISLLPFRTDIKDVILCHHENADGSGALGRTAAQTPLKAQILHLADLADMKCKLSTLTEEEFEELRAWMQQQSGRLFSGEVVALFLKAVDFEKIRYMQQHGVEAYLYETFPLVLHDYSDEEIHHIADLFAKIIDYKSIFTEAHSKNVAQKAETMARYYGFDAEKTIEYYFAGAMHDIGKLMIRNNILEKTGKLTVDEFAEMKNHASATRYILSQMRGIPDIVDWAANHHEKLNGTGYPQGLKAEQLSFEERLMACIDIYQALTERRPYKDGMTHEQAISMMLEMVQKGELDETIVRDIATVFQ